MYKRIIQTHIISECFQGKAVIIYGPRQVGKTTLTKRIIEHFTEKRSTYLNADDLDIQELLTPRLSVLSGIVNSVDILIIDEAQRIENIGLIIKLLVDNYPEKQIIATGSSSFDLANKISEPLTGRAYIYHLYPLSIEETHPQEPITSGLLSQRLIYGSYPDVVNNTSRNPKEHLSHLVQHYLYKDILTYQGITKHKVVHKILQALALQIGSEFSYNEIANTVGVDKNTVEKYIHILEQAFIIKILHPLHSNQRREIKSNKKAYFRDLGIRNAIIDNYNPINLRTDTGGLRENFFIIERIKYTSYHKIYTQQHFWRRTDAGEIDYIESANNLRTAFECKFSNKKGASIPNRFQEKYPNNSFHVIQPQNIGERIR